MYKTLNLHVNNTVFFDAIFPGLHAVGKHFDTVFIDADQREPANYYNFVLENHLLREDGVICMENTLMKGQVYLENISDENVLAVRKLNTVINSDPCVEQVSVMQLVKGNIGILSTSGISSA